MRTFFVSMLVAGAAAAQQDFSKVQIQVAKVAGNVYFLKGSGGNIAATVGDDGVAIVDAQFLPLAPKIHAALSGLSKKPVKFLINTHWHFDHVGGNQAFADTATILAQSNTRGRMERGADTIAGHQDPAPKEALPVVTFEQGLSLWWNGEEIRAIHPGLGHTDGDVVVWFTKSNVVHMGDDFVTYGFPFIDLKSGGSVTG
ncbi:MAG TPA: MBL fold metallo-hydrolase, partial [Longimicrobium sp.]|nr:MBL fold metallo-hydrolase [Longimicrobium sp.]